MTDEYTDDFTDGYRRGYVSGYEEGTEDGRFQGYREAKFKAFVAFHGDDDAKKELEKVLGEE